MFIASYLYFRKLRVVGRENVPIKGPLIFAINHQNALLDALLLSVLSVRNPHFLTRGDIFKKKFVDKLLRGVKMLPIYRIRDGFDSVKMNAPIFEATKKILKKGGVVGIFPEGSHSLLYKIRPLKKGIARIAFMSEAASDFDLNLQIIPIGIQYESHFFTWGRTIVSFGKPIRVSDYKEIYINDQNKAHEKLLESISHELKSLVLHVEDKADYDQVLKVFHEKRVFNQLRADQALVDAIVNGSDFVERPDKKNVLIGFVRKGWDYLWKVVGFIPEYIVDRLVMKTTKDPHFYGTMRFAYSIFLYPIFYLIVYFVIKLAMF